MARPGTPALTGKRILVTGGSSGIGLTCAERMGAAGAQLALLARGRVALQQAGRMVPGCVGTICADVSDADQMQASLHEVADMLGGLDVVVAAASVGAYGPFGELSVDDYMGTLETTLVGTINTAHAALPYLLSSQGTFVAVGSVAGRLPTPWMSGYAAANHGVRGFIRSLAGELRAQHAPVRVALVAPGPVDTRFWRRTSTAAACPLPAPWGAHRPEDVAAGVIRAICSPRGRTERTVGGLTALCAWLDALAPEVTLRALGILGAAGWRRRTSHPVAPPETRRHPGPVAARRGV